MNIDLERLGFAHSVPTVEAFTVLRGTVDSGDSYSAVNLCHYVGDDAKHVADSREAFCEKVGVATSRLVVPRQTHSVSVAVVTEDNISADFNEVDALVTKLPDVVIGVNTADCVPIVLCDAEADVIAVAHAGWKGTVGRIAERTVEAMVAQGADVKRIEAAIGASICPECFEVGDEVVGRFAQADFPIDRIMHRNAATGKAHIDLWQANALSLMAAGVDEENIVLSHRCTRCNPDRYFSARRLGINSGRTFTAVIRRG